uniref:DDE Tnp4 domain-containing protein n=1 Tax=Anopheles atroparvus TaxID=41427 RepID=A0AAG5DWM0_ANOAO
RYPSVIDFDYLLEQIGPKISKTDTNMRKSLSAKDKLIVTLRFLATGDNYKTLEYTFRISAQSIGIFIPEVCDSLIEVLRDFVKLPTCPDEWLKVAQGFQEKYNFPHVLGAIDGKHVAIKAPPHSGTDYFNYKIFFSLVLLRVVDSKSNFIYADVGILSQVYVDLCPNNDYCLPSSSHLSVHFWNLTVQFHIIAKIFVISKVKLTHFNRDQCY